MIKYKIICYSSTGIFKKNLENVIENKIDFGETINTGQGELVLKLNEPFTSEFYKRGDIIEITIYDDNFKQGIPRYTGCIHSFRRNYTDQGEWISIKIYGIFDFLNDIKVTKTYSGILKDIIDEIITDSGTANNITSKPTPILGGTKLKNLITSTLNVSLEVEDKDLFDVLVELFKLTGLNFYINQKGEIVEESSEILLIPSSKQGIQIEIDENLQTRITVQNNLIKNYSPNKPIKILNMPNGFNLAGNVIQGIDYNETDTTILLGRALRFDDEGPGLIVGNED